ncbi:MAG TPA: hypothetical protein VGC66_20775 [Pyrinomonadaceae bacterium]
MKAKKPFGEINGLRRRRIQRVARGRGGREATSASGQSVVIIRALKGARRIDALPSGRE